MTSQLPDPELLERANAAGIRLEIVRGVPTWEAAPALGHQMAIDRIRATIRPLPGSPCACFHASDVYVLFPDGSRKRPDVAIWCRQPDELVGAVTLIPEAVIEVISPGYEAKDLEIGPALYLQHGVRDVITFDPRSGQLHRYDRSGYVVKMSPAKLTLQCGCEIEV
jgi:Uma2 family endonuclease